MEAVEEQEMKEIDSERKVTDFLPTLLGCSGEWPHVKFFNPTDATRVAKSPRLGVGPGFDSQGSVTFFHKYCFPNLH